MSDSVPAVPMRWENGRLVESLVGKCIYEFEVSRVVV